MPTAEIWYIRLAHASEKHALCRLVAGVLHSGNKEGVQFIYKLLLIKDFLPIRLLRQL
jgi:hypothetical protein